MTVIACFEAIALTVIVYLMLQHMRAGEQAWTLERRELLTRIQRPDLLPVATAEPFVLPDDEPDELGLVGTVSEES